MPEPLRNFRKTEGNIPKINIFKIENGAENEIHPVKDNKQCNLENLTTSFLLEKQSGSSISLQGANNHIIRTKETVLSSQINICIEETKPKIPDGGWGWLVVFGCFFINLVSDGVGCTFGLLNVQFLNEFKASNSATSLIGSLFLSVPLLAGPLGSALVDRYGCKYMTVMGSVISTVGFIISAYVKQIWVMYITFGVIGGIGFGLCYVTAVVSIAFWFKKHRTLALGIAASGSGFGTVIYSPLVTYLLREYGWRGSILILAGIGANMCASGLVMRDPEWILQEERIEKTKRRKPLIPKTKYEIEDIETTLSRTQKHNKHSSSLLELPTFLQEHQEVPIEVLRKLSENKKLYNIILENYPNILSYKSASETILFSDKSVQDLESTKLRVPVRFCMKLKEAEQETNNIELQNENQSRVPLLRSDSTRSKGHSSQQPHHNYMKNIRFRKNSMGYRGAMLNLHKYKLAASSCPDFFKNSVMSLEEDEDEEWYDDYVEVYKDITNLSLFNDLHFMLLGISTIIMCIWFVVPYFYLPVHMTVCGYTENQASFSLSLIGFTNIIGMVLFAIIGNKVNVVKVYAVCLVGCGITCITMMLFTRSYFLLIVSCGLFGLFFASVNALTPSILGDLVPLENFTMAYGMFLLCQGIGNLAGPPIAGLLYDLTQAYDQSFYQAGYWVIFSGILVGLIPYTENRKLFSSDTQFSDKCVNI